MAGENEFEKLEKLEHEAEHIEEELKEKFEEIKEEIKHIEEREHEPFSIKVNNKSVPIVGHEHTGLEIKQAAITAGVRIQLDFILSEELSHNRSRIVGDEQRIKVDKDSCFEAIPNDDHS